MELSHKVREAQKNFGGEKVAITFYRNDEPVATASVWDGGHSMHAVREASIIAGSPTAEYTDRVIAIVQRIAWDAEPTPTLSIYE